MSYIPPTATSTTAVEAARSTPKWHTAHDGWQSMSIEVSDGDVIVYIRGSRSEIVAWAAAVRAEAIKGEEGD